MRTKDGFLNTDLDTVLNSANTSTHSDEAGYCELLHREKKESIKGQTQDRKQRKTFASKIYKLTIAWLSVIGGILLLQGFLSPWNWFKLSDSVLIALISGASVNIIGLMAIVIRYLFPTNGKK